MQQVTPRLSFIPLLEQNYFQALAWVSGNDKFPKISGLIRFYDTPYNGVLIESEVFGLPNISTPGSSDFYAMHIHETGDCTPPFDKTGAHYNPTNEIHPEHAGDLLPLLSNQGYAWSVFLDRRFKISDIIGRSVIIHLNRDDFTTQPSGDSGEKIACGVIRSVIQ